MKYRKRNLLIIAILLIYMIIYVPVNAQTEPEQSETMLIDVLKNTNEDLISDVLSIDPSSEELQSLDLEGKPKLLVFVTSFFYYADQPLEKAIAAAQDRVRIVLLQEDPIVISGYKSKQRLEVCCNYYAENPMPKYLQDIISGTAVQSFSGQECVVENIICFDAINSHSGAVLIFETDNGRFIRYYEYRDFDAVEFTWDSFIQLASGYEEYLLSTAYDAFGNSSGGNPTFSSYANNPEKYKPRTPFWHYLVIAAGTIAAAAGIIYIGIQCRKRYLRHKYAAFDIDI